MCIDPSLLSLYPFSQDQHTCPLHVSYTMISQSYHTRLLHVPYILQQMRRAISILRFNARDKCLVENPPVQSKLGRFCYLEKSC
jgi:hypothetical protein